MAVGLFAVHATLVVDRNGDEIGRAVDDKTVVAEIRNVYLIRRQIGRKRDWILTDAKSGWSR